MTEEFPTISGPLMVARSATKLAAFEKILERDLRSYLSRCSDHSFDQLVKLLALDGREAGALHSLRRAACTSDPEYFSTVQASVCSSQPGLLPIRLSPFRPERRDHIDSVLRGARVALVGPSPSLEGRGLGTKIDGFDLVVRMNSGWPIRYGTKSDTGTRCDILYHSCNGDSALTLCNSQDLCSLRFVCFQRNVQAWSLCRRCEREEVPVYDVSPVYRHATHELGTPASTGLVAIEHLLSFPIKELAIFGMTFFLDGYLQGYVADGARFFASTRHPEQMRRIAPHSSTDHLRLFKERYLHDVRLTLDSALHRALAPLGEDKAR